MNGSVYFRLSKLEELVSNLKSNRCDIVEMYIDNPDPSDDELSDTLFVSGIDPSNQGLIFETDIDSDDSFAHLFDL